MKVYIQKEVLVQALNKLNKLVDKKSRLAILGFIKCSITQDNLTMSVSTLEHELYVTIPCTTDYSDNYEFLIELKGFHSLVKSLVKGEILLEWDKQEMIVSQNGFNTTFKINSDTSNFPVNEYDKESASVLSYILPQSLKQGIEAVKHAMAKQDVRYYLNGILFTFQEHNLLLVATDGHRLAKHNIVEHSVKPIGEKIVHNEVVPALIDSIGKQTSDMLISLTPDNRFIVFEGEGFRLVSRLVDGQYPNWRNVIPSNLHEKLKVNRKSFVQVLETIVKTSSDKYPRVDLKIEADKLHLESKSCNTAILCEATLDDEKSFNAKYLLEALKSLDCDEVRINYNVDNLVITINDDLIVMGLRK